MWHSSTTLRFCVTFLYNLISLCAYTAWFYYRLGLSFGLLSFGYTALFAGILTACIFLSRHWLWKASCFILGMVFSLYVLISFLHFSVFKTFLSFSVGSELSFYALWTTISDFYYLVPVDMYSASGMWLLLYGASVIFFSKKKPIHTQFCGTPLLHKKKYVPTVTTAVSTLILSICFVFVFVSSSYYHLHPKESWWNQSVFYGDNGLFGFVYNQLFSYIVESSKPIDTAFAQEFVPHDDMPHEMNVSTTQQTTKPKTPFENIDMYINSLPSRGEKHVGRLPAVSSTPHIIIYQLESIDSWIFSSDPDPMPFLKELMEKNIHVDHFIANGCHTIDAEFATMCSFYPHSKGAISSRARANNFSCLPSLLSHDYGYRTAVFHSNKSDFWNRDVLMPKWGIQDQFFIPEFAFPKVSDDKVIDKAITYVSATSTPSFSYIISYTSHAPHTSREIEWNKKFNGITITPYEGSIDVQVGETVELKTERDIRTYLGFAQEIDRDIKHLFDLLEQKKLMENTVVVIVADHRYYNFVNRENPLQGFLNYNELPFVIYTPGLQLAATSSVQQYASHIDIAPTLLNIIQGSSYTKPEQFVGESLLSSQHPNHAILKCLGQVNLVSPDLVVSGNNMLNVYQALYQSENISQRQLDASIRNLNTLSHYSNSLIDANILVPSTYSN